MLLLKPDFKGGYYCKVWPNDEWHRYSRKKLDSWEEKESFSWMCDDCDVTTIHYDGSSKDYPKRCPNCNKFKTRYQINKTWSKVVWKKLKTPGILKLVGFTKKNPIHSFFGTTHKHIGKIILQDCLQMKREFLRLKRSALFKRTYNGGFYCFEATAKIRTESDTFVLDVHPHIHMIAKCNKMDYQDLKKWEDRYGIRTNHKRVNDIKGAIGYITNYISKDRTFTSRLRDSFGVFRGVDINDNDKR